MALDAKYGQVTVELGDIPEDEPVFLIRAQDSAAGQIVRQYAQVVAGHGATPEFYESVHKVADDIDRWQEANPDKVGTPD